MRQILALALVTSGCIRHDFPAQPIAANDAVDAQLATPADASVVHPIDAAPAEVLADADATVDCEQPLSNLKTQFATTQELLVWAESEKAKGYGVDVAHCPDGSGIVRASTGFSSQTWFFSTAGQVVGAAFMTDTSSGPPCAAGMYGDTKTCAAADMRFDLPDSTSLQPLDPALAATVTAAALIAQDCTTTAQVWTGDYCGPSVTIRQNSNEWDIWLFDNTGKLQNLWQEMPPDKKLIISGPLVNCLTDPAFFALATGKLVCNNGKKL